MRFVCIRTRAASSYDAIKKVKILTLWHFLFLCTGFVLGFPPRGCRFRYGCSVLQLRLAFPIVSHRAFRGTADLHKYISSSAVVIMHKSIPAMPIAPLPPSSLGQHLALGKKGKFLGVEKTNKSVKCP